MTVSLWSRCSIYLSKIVVTAYLQYFRFSSFLACSNRRFPSGLKYMHEVVDLSRTSKRVSEDDKKILLQHAWKLVRLKCRQRPTPLRSITVSRLAPR